MRQPESSVPAVDVESYCPKLSPVTVTEERPDSGPFGRTADAMGASKLYKSTTVPASAATVTLTRVKLC